MCSGEPTSATMRTVWTARVDPCLSNAGELLRAGKGRRANEARMGLLGYLFQTFASGQDSLLERIAVEEPAQQAFRLLVAHREKTTVKQR